MRVVSSDNNDVKLAVSAGNHIYEYTLSSNSATRVGKPAFEIANVPIKKRWALLEDKRIMDFAGIAVSVPAATGALSKISAATERLTAGPRLGLYIAGAAILATGGIVGYLTTYNDAADYDNETFQKTLLDSANWHETARLIKACGIIKRAFEIISEIELSNHDDGEKPAASLRDSARSAELRRTCSNIQAWLADHL